MKNASTIKRRSSEFKARVVRESLTSDGAGSKAAKRAGIAPKLVSRWISEYRSGTGWVRPAGAEPSPLRKALLTEEVRWLRGEIKRRAKNLNPGCQSLKARLEFVRRHSAGHCTRMMCAHLGLSPSTYYSWLARKDRPPTESQRRRMKLREEAVRIFRRHRGSIGSRRVWAELREMYPDVGMRLVLSALRDQGLKCRYHGRPSGARRGGRTSGRG